MLKEFIPEEFHGEWKWVRRGFAALAAVAMVWTSVYTVPANSVGVEKRLGKYHATTDPGINFKLPYPIDTVHKVPVQQVQKEEFGFRTLQAGVNSTFLDTDNVSRLGQGDLEDFIRSAGEAVNQSGNIRGQAEQVLRGEYLMLTGDLNLADVEWIVQYKVKDAPDYLFNLRDPGQTIRDASQAVMRRIIGNGSVDEVITIGRIEYETYAKEELQKILDTYGSGIHVVTVKLQSSNPPKVVQPAFNEVNSAMQGKEQRINEAMQNYNEAVPKARGEAAGMIQTAEGYAAERVNQAEGDVNKFKAMLAEYAKAPEITRQRMYFETMGKILPNIHDKWVVEQKGAEGGVLLKLDVTNPGQQALYQEVSK